jgi:hypothetical protein
VTWLPIRNCKYSMFRLLTCNNFAYPHNFELCSFVTELAILTEDVELTLVLKINFWNNIQLIIFSIGVFYFHCSL